MRNDIKICVIGLGYVGLPLAVEFSKKYNTVGFDVNKVRIEELTRGVDLTLEVTAKELDITTNLKFTSDPSEIKQCNIYVVTVPTPINNHKQPDCSYLISASTIVGQILKQDDIVIYESTVYPGATEEVCVPVLEEQSGLKYNDGFYVGYSPERINPGDKDHRVTNICKVTSGSTPEIAEFIDELYSSIIIAGTHKASSIRVAEAAKVIENTQRDVNIALINELAILFNRMGIDTLEVLNAAGTKWNFLPFRPGLVGGHCIGVDPYYLTHKAKELGYEPEIILAGRRLNDSIGSYIAECVVKLMTQKRIHVVDANVLILGFTFKENCPDVRNTRVIDIVREFGSYNTNVDVYDPWVSIDEVEKEYSLKPVAELKKDTYDAIIVAVAHDQIKEMGIDKIRALCRKNHVIYDIKSLFDAGEVDARL